MTRVKARVLIMRDGGWSYTFKPWNDMKTQRRNFVSSSTRNYDCKKLPKESLIWENIYMCIYIPKHILTVGITNPCLAICSFMRMQLVVCNMNEVLIYSPWWRNKMEICSALLVLCEGNPPVTGFPSAELWFFLLWSPPEQTVKQTI